MKKLLSIVAASALLWGGLAEAHGPTRQKTTESIQINASPDAVWAVVGDFAHPEKWMPMVASTTAQGGNEKGAIRELKLKSGGAVKEELKELDAQKKVVKYKAVDPTDPKVLPVNNYAAEITVEPSAGGSKVEWKSAYYRWFLNNNPPADQNEEAANSTVSKIYKESLSNLKTVVESKK